MGKFLQVTDITGIKVGDTVVFRDGRSDVVVGTSFFGDPIETILVCFKSEEQKVEEDSDSDEYYVEVPSQRYRLDGIHAYLSDWDIVAINATTSPAPEDIALQLIKGWLDTVDPEEFIEEFNSLGKGTGITIGEYLEQAYHNRK